ncbi:unnamed protein product [Closterium sp. NIES-64]|nr:unnamed protein product [Closterium sp. NIES-64]
MSARGVFPEEEVERAKHRGAPAGDEKSGIAWQPPSNLPLSSASHLLLACFIHAAAYLIRQYERTGVYPEEEVERAKHRGAPAGDEKSGIAWQPPSNLPLSSHRGALPRLPIIAVTANALKEDEERCYAVGMDGFLGKPVQFPKLKEAISEFIELPGSRLLQGAGSGMSGGVGRGGIGQSNPNSGASGGLISMGSGVAALLAGIPPQAAGAPGFPAPSKLSGGVQRLVVPARPSSYSGSGSASGSMTYTGDEEDYQGEEGEFDDEYDDEYDDYESTVYSPRSAAVRRGARTPGGASTARTPGGASMARTPGTTRSFRTSMFYDGREDRSVYGGTGSVYGGAESVNNGSDWCDWDDEGWQGEGHV